MKFAAVGVVLTCACGQKLAYQAKTSPGLGAAPPAFDASNAGKNDTLGYILSMTPASVQWREGHWSYTAKQSASRGATSCSVSFVAQVQGTYDDNDNTSRNDERGGSVDFAGQVAATNTTGFENSYCSAPSAALAAMGSYMALVGGDGNMLVYLSSPSACTEMRSVMLHLHDLCTLGREPN